MNDLLLLSAAEQTRRLDKVYTAMQACGIDRALICSNANLYYLTGRVYSGYMLLQPSLPPMCFVKRPVHLVGDNVVSIRKPEEIPAKLAERGMPGFDGRLGLELGRIDYNTAIRLVKAMDTRSENTVDAGAALAVARSTKTEEEIDKIRTSAIRHTAVYERIPRIYRPGMSDIELQIDIERRLRLDGCLGKFAIAGADMEMYMGNVLAGDNADAPSPYDFAMGGAGIDPSLPIGANGTIIRQGMCVMVDMNGNFTGYMDDMTRCYACGTLAPEAMDAYRLSVEICHELQNMGTPGTEARALYEKALQMASEAGFDRYFMGHRQHAGFVGHGVGIEVNELPVLAPRSRDILAAGNVIAVEPKFVIPGTGAVGIENTYVVRPRGPMECLTLCTEKLVEL